MPLGLSFDNVGPLARTVEDAALILQGHRRLRPQGPDDGNRARARFPQNRERGRARHDARRRDQPFLAGGGS